MKIEVLKAGSTLSGAGDERFTLAALKLSEDPNPEVRQTVRYVYEDGQRGALNLDPSEPSLNLSSHLSGPAADAKPATNLSSSQTATDATNLSSRPERPVPGVAVEARWRDLLFSESAIKPWVPHSSPLLA